MPADTCLLPDLIKPDQTGFVKAIFGTDNVRRALNIINHLGRIKDPPLIVSLGAEKAFDRVEWKLLYAELEKVNLGDSILTHQRQFTQMVNYQKDLLLVGTVVKAVLYLLLCSH